MIEKKYKTYPVSGISRHCLFIIQMTRSAEIFSFFKFTVHLDFNFFIGNIFKIVIIMILHDTVASSFQFLLIKVYQVR